MKRLFSIILVLSLLCGASFASEASGVYKLGDKMEDFTAILTDGSEVSLYGLLAEKKAVLINFWATWCNPCRMEFPAIQSAYDEMSDEIGIIALSVEATDTDEKIIEMKEELGLTSIPMGRDTGVSKRFEMDGIPTSVMVDRNGVICFIHSGSLPDEAKFKRLFAAFTADDYSQSVLLNDIPAAAFTGVYPTAAEIGSALGVADERIKVLEAADKTSWPFVVSGDGTYIEASNGSDKETSSLVTFEVASEAGQALAYDYSLNCVGALDNLTISVDGEIRKFYSGDIDWKSDYVKFGEAGTHIVEISYNHSLSSFIDETAARIKGARIMPADEVASLDAQFSLSLKPKVLSGDECAIEVLDENVKTIIMKDSMSEQGDTDPMYLVAGGSLNFRVKIGADVNENLAFIAQGQNAHMLSNLETDGEGYLFEAELSSLKNGENESPVNMFYVYSNALDLQNASSSRCTCFASEEDADAYANMIEQLALASGLTDFEMSWEYEDGSPKQGSLPVEAAAIDDGTAKYIISVTDEAGHPLEGAMIQICDPTTCQVAATDKEGIVTHEAPRYPYEIHLLMAPEGYQSDSQVYVMPEEGGTLTIVLKK